MKNIDIDLENQDFADEMIRHIEKDYGRSIARIADFQRTGATSFDLKIIFTDFRLLEAEMRVVPQFFDLPQITIHGTYY